MHRVTYGRVRISAANSLSCRTGNLQEWQQGTYHYSAVADPDVFSLPTEEEIDRLREQETQRCATDLGLSEPDHIAALSAAVEKALRQYLTEKLARSLWKSAKDQKQQLAILRTLLTRTSDGFSDLNAEYVVAIGQLAERSDGGNTIDIVDLPNQLLKVAAGITDFLDRFEPPRGPPTDRALESAVRVLLPVIEDLAGVEAKIRWNKNTGRPPEPRSSSASALVRILRQFPRPSSSTAILNMIRKVQERPRRKPGDLEAVIRTHFDELDASLQPGREC